MRFSPIKFVGFLLFQRELQHLEQMSACQADVRLTALILLLGDMQIVCYEVSLYTSCCPASLGNAKTSFCATLASLDNEKRIECAIQPPKILFPLLSYTQFFIVDKVFSFRFS